MGKCYQLCFFSEREREIFKNMFTSPFSKLVDPAKLLVNADMMMMMMRIRLHYILQMLPSSAGCN